MFVGGEKCSGNFADVTSLIRRSAATQAAETLTRKEGHVFEKDILGIANKIVFAAMIEQQ